MTAAEELRAWVLARSSDDVDARAASKMIARYVAECVRQDRAKQDEARVRQDRARQQIAESIGRMKDIMDRGPFGRSGL